MSGVRQSARRVATVGAFALSAVGLTMFGALAFGHSTDHSGDNVNESDSSPVAGPRGNFGPANFGQFSVHCQFSHRAPDDPIVSPRKSDASHSHDFFGNFSTDSSSTLKSLREAGTTCNNPNDLSGYWVPTLYEGRKAVTPQGANIYYRTGRREPSEIRPFPRGLKMIGGDARATGVQDTDVVSWSCGEGVTRQQTVPTCEAGGLVVRINFPDCWDGKNLDSKNHRSHMAYSQPEDSRTLACPSSHPVAVPKVLLNVRYPSRGGSKVALASGPATSAHGDFFNVWDKATLERLVNDCLRQPQHCRNSFF